MKNTQSSGVPFIPFIRGGVKENDIEASFFFYILPAAFPSQKSLFAEHSTLDWALLQCAVLRAHWSVRVYYPIANEKQCSWRRCVLRLAARDNFIATRFVSIGSWWPVAWHTLKTSCFFSFFFAQQRQSPYPWPPHCICGGDERAQKKVQWNKNSCLKSLYLLTYL